MVTQLDLALSGKSAMAQNKAGFQSAGCSQSVAASWLAFETLIY